MYERLYKIIQTNIHLVVYPIKELPLLKGSRVESGRCRTCRTHSLFRSKQPSCHHQVHVPCLGSAAGSASVHPEVSTVETRSVGAHERHNGTVDNCGVWLGHRGQISRKLPDGNVTRRGGGLSIWPPASMGRPGRFLRRADHGHPRADALRACEHPGCVL